MRELKQINYTETRFITDFCKLCQYKNIVEIGVSHGNTTIMLCEIAKELGGKVFGYDYFEPINAYVKHHQGVYSYDKVYNYIKSFGYDDDLFKLTKVDTQNEEFSKILKEDTKGIIDFAFIDGCHSYEGVKNDFKTVYPLLSEDGSIVLHDTYSHTGCRKFVLDLYQELNDGTYDILTLPFGGGVNRWGFTIITKRYYPLYNSGITINDHETLTQSNLMPEDVYTEEKKWYQSQLKNN